MRSSPVVGLFLCPVLGSYFCALLLWGSVSELNDNRQDILEQVIGNPPFGLGANGLNPSLNSGNGFLLELMGTLLLCLTVVMTCLHSKGLAQGVPNMAPIAIGFAVFLSHLVLIPLTGCGINPARTFGPAIVNTIAGQNVWGESQWIYCTGPFAAATVAALIFKFIMTPDEEEVDKLEKEGAPEPSVRNEDQLALDLMSRMNRNLAGRPGSMASTGSEEDV